jgi:hypothetical protein
MNSGTRQGDNTSNRKATPHANGNFPRESHGGTSFARKVGKPLKLETSRSQKTGGKERPRFYIMAMENGTTGQAKTHAAIGQGLPSPPSRIGDWLIFPPFQG